MSVLFDARCQKPSCRGQCGPLLWGNPEGRFAEHPLKLTGSLMVVMIAIVVALCLLKGGCCDVRADM